MKTIKDCNLDYVSKINVDISTMIQRRTENGEGSFGFKEPKILPDFRIEQAGCRTGVQRDWTPHSALLATI